MKQKIDVKTLIDIERIIRGNKKTGEYNLEKMEEIFKVDYDKSRLHVQAFELASLMPLGEISRAIREYDESSPKMDELKFVKELAEKYNVKKGQVITRIQHVRRINNELRRHL